MQNWTAIYQKTSPKVYGICLRYVKDTDLAQDLVQETFETAINKSTSFKGKGSVEGWIKRIAVNKCIDYLRKEQKFVKEILNEELVTEKEEEAMGISNKAIILGTGFTNEELLTAIDQLPDHHKQVFNMYVIDKIGHKEIAEILKISVGTSKSHLSRARKNVQKALLSIAEGKQEKKKRRLGIFYFLPIGFGLSSMFRSRLYGGVPLPQQNIPDFISSADASYVPIPKTKFLYTAAGKTVIVTSVIAATTIGAGLAYNSSNANSKRGVEVMESKTFNQLPTHSIGIKKVKEVEVLDVKSHKTSVKELNKSVTVKNNKKEPEQIIRKTVVKKKKVFVAKKDSVE